MINLKKQEFIKLENDFVGSLKEFETSYTEILINTNNNINVELNLLESSTLKLVLVGSGNISKFNLVINVYKGAHLDIYESVISTSDIENNINIKLLGEGSTYNLYEFLPALKNKVSGKFVVDHLSKDTTSSGSFYYLSNKGGKIKRDVISNIPYDMFNSKSMENIKGLIMYSDSLIEAKPILMVSCDEVSASHGCAIGTIDDNEIYYLMSRGLTKEEARRIIAMSLINPLLREIKTEEFKNEASRILVDAVGE